MNFVFVSPNFPSTYWNFCDRLQRNGVNVLGIGDAPFDSLAPELKRSLTEYYRVESMSNYDEMYRAVAFLAFRHGRIDWLESNNEYWLEQDARLRSDFNITTGVNASGVARFKSKSGMKDYYAKGGVPTARCHRVSTIDDARDFIEEIGGYPAFAKPDVGVGAEGTYKIENDAELKRFFADKPDVPYALEEFVTGDIYSYDAIIDSHGKPLFESSSVFPPSMAEVVENQLDLEYRTLPSVPAQLRARGRATVKAFKVTSRFVHFEFFRLTKAKSGLGKVGDFVGLEVNMRPAGGYTPDMMDIAHATDIYQIWADMVVYDKRLLLDSDDHQYCVYAARRDIHSYAHSAKDVLSRYCDEIHMAGRMPDALSDDLGNQFFMAREPDQKKANAFASYVLRQSR